jgi:hypothetical protein
VHPGIFFGIALFFGIFLFAGSSANQYIIYLVGLNGMGIFTLLTGVTLPNKSDWINKQFQTNKRYPAIVVSGIVTLIGIGMLMGSIDYWRDLPFYQNHDFTLVSGKPTSIDEYTSKGTVTGLHVEIAGEIFILDADLPNFPNFKEVQELKDKKFTIHYLPNSHWILDYRVEIE